MIVKCQTLVGFWQQWQPTTQRTHVYGERNAEPR
jgi:hypothetical protein